MGLKDKRKRPRPEADDGFANSIEDRGLPSEPSSKKAKIDQRRSLFVRSLPASATSESLAEFFSEYFPVRHATVVVDQKTKESRGFGFVTFADGDDAAQAKQALDKKLWEGRNIRIDVAEPRSRNEADGEKTLANGKTGKPGKAEYDAPSTKLIVRNLPWSIKTSDQLGHLFRSFGKVKFADLPSNKGKLKGFGFVTLRGKKNAEKALEDINGKEIDGRTLAVDWAVDKQTWNKHRDLEADKDEDDSDATSSEGSSSGDDDGEVEEPDKDDGEVKTQLDQDLENFMKNHMQNLDEDENTSDEDKDGEEDEDEDEDEDQLEEETQPTPVKSRSTDNSTTVFIRNLPFTTNDEQLKAFFAHFGSVRYARVVMDKATDRPAGTGFVCFFNEDDSKACVKNAPRPDPNRPTTAGKHSILQDESADPDGKYTLDGRLLQVAQAVGKAEASHLADASSVKRREKDKRRLFLLNEGSIGSNNPLYHLLSETEIHMRQASAAQRRKLVQSNPSLHLSLTRLAIRNIPRNLGSRDMKELARKAIVGFATDVREGRRQPLSKEENARDGREAKEKEKQRKQKGKGIVKQAKVVFEGTQGSKVTEKSGAGKSRGYGFIEYVSHHYALMGLRYLNGHQLTDDNGKKMRLVVEFAIENAQVVQRRRQIEEKSSQGPKKQRQAEEMKVNDNADEEEQKGQHAKGKRSHKKNEQEGGHRDGGDAESKASKKLAMKQKIIGRKRLMRKQKAAARKTK